tara:strand:- start:1179 stop:1364 length:186 start_codon:yes stop_codon:yes gene_type:complete
MIINEFFNLEVADANGHMYKANWRQKLAWIKRGCPKQNKKALKRLCRMRLSRLKRSRGHVL